MSDRLLDKRFKEYRGRPIPHELDQVVTSVVDVYRQAAARERSEMIGWVRPGPAALLVIYGERMAAVAVRSGSVAPLHDGLTAMALGLTRHEDHRDVVISLAAVNHAAETIGVNPTGLVGDLSSLFPPIVLDFFRQFFAQGPRNKSLAAMGLRTCGSGQDFRYGG